MWLQTTTTSNRTKAMYLFDLCKVYRLLMLKFAQLPASLDAKLRMETQTSLTCRGRRVRDIKAELLDVKRLALFQLQVLYDVRGWPMRWTNWMCDRAGSARPSVDVAWLLILDGEQDRIKFWHEKRRGPSRCRGHLLPEAILGEQNIQNHYRPWDHDALYWVLNLAHSTDGLARWRFPLS